jgi:hypothetical protein
LVDSEKLRRETFAYLESLGFRPAGSLPLPDVDRQARPAIEIEARLMALHAVYKWVTGPRIWFSTDRLRSYIERNRLREWMDEEESGIVSLGRGQAHKTHLNTIGWRLENMWPLAWALGFEPVPTIEASQIDDEINLALVRRFVPELEGKLAGLAEAGPLRGREELIALEYRFYCAHNAVRNAQLGRDTVPKGFHPLAHGGAVHERRHALTWMLSPGVPWDETDLST